MNNRNIHLHSVENARALVSVFRYRFQNPEKLLKPYIKPVMTVLDLGCGPGFFATAIARLLNGSGKVIAADLQSGMLELLNQEIKETNIENIIELHKCQEKSLQLNDKFDFVLAFYAFHEMRYLDIIIEELTALMKPNGRIFVAEQKFHVSRTTFLEIINKLQQNGFEITEKPKVFLSRSVIMKLTN